MRRKAKSWIWGEYRIHERLDSCFRQAEKPITNEDNLRKLLARCFHEIREGIPFQIILHLPKERKAPGCPKVLFVLTEIRNFSDRTLEALEVVRKCKGEVEGVLYLTLAWKTYLHSRLEFIAEVFRDYGVLDVCRREPIVASVPVYY